ncbi:E3 ubiquitin-protein ligase TRIM39-like isoform X2 [Ambystoma mexicanum]|uniref:E3 ubiquitin-protein ligase TRIM39-like isoform X2 n=1 Tax=Ambystoma mexicanum TaxID=8296 RepID=UPI0037E7DEC5
MSLKVTYKKMFEQQLKTLKLDLMAEMARFQEEEKLKAAELEVKVQQQGARILREFEELQQFLEEEKLRFLTRLETEREEILQMTLEKGTQLEEKRTSIMMLITEMEDKCHQPDVDIQKDLQRAIRRFSTLKDIKNRFDSKEQVKILQSFGQESIDLQQNILESLEWRRACLFSVEVMLDP